LSASLCAFRAAQLLTGAFHEDILLMFVMPLVEGGPKKKFFS
jgi:hypothetical protein